MPHRVEIRTGARLHFGPLSYLPARGRHFGGIGLMIAEPRYQVRVSFERSGLMVDSGETEEVQLLHRWRKTGRFSELPPVRIETLSQLPQHCGFGSGTQRALAVGEALSRLAGLPTVDIPDLARRLGRGARSAIGIHGYQQGGFLIDAGQTGPDTLGEAAARVEFPPRWTLLLIRPRAASENVAGDLERTQFEKLASMPEADSGILCRLVLTEILPALQNRDLRTFNAALGEYGQIVGSFFEPVQGGIYRSPLMRSVAAWVRERLRLPVVQSSWGPAVAVICGDADVAATLRNQLELEFPQTLTIAETGPMNSPRLLTVDA